MIDPEIRQAWKRIKAALPEERSNDIKIVGEYMLLTAIHALADQKSMPTDQTTQEHNYSVWIKLKRRVEKYTGRR